MANGRLLQRAECREALRDAAARVGTTPDALALAIAMHQPFKPMVLSGAATVEHLRCACVCAHVCVCVCVRVRILEIDRSMFSSAGDTGKGTHSLRVVNVLVKSHIPVQEYAR